MDGERVHIDSLTLRVPGLTTTEARDLGRAVVNKVAAQVPARSTPLHLGALDLRVTLPPGTRRDQMAAHIADAILEALQ
jgi:hypothetical protein